MLRSLFDWLDANPGFYWLPAILATVAMIGDLLHTILRDAATPLSRTRRVITALVLPSFLLAWRWPFLFAAHEYNPDESQLIAGALTLAHDPVFWRSVDGTTSGPLNFYALLPLHLIGAPMDYFMARLTGLLLIWVALLGCERLVRSVYSPAVARLSLFPAAVFFAAAIETDFIHYSSEHVSLMLTGLAAGLIASRRADDTRYGSLWLAGGVVAGMLPWAKLQAGPIGAVLLAYGLACLWFDPTRSPEDKRRLTLRFTLAAGAATAGFVAVAIVTGQAGNLLGNYLLQNLNYVQTGQTITGAAQSLWERSSHVGHYPAHVLGSLAVIAASLAAGWRHLRPMRNPWVLGAGLTLVSIGCVLAAKRDFTHYLLLTIIPLSIWFGGATGSLWSRFKTRKGKWITTALVLTAGLIPLGMRLNQPVPHMFGSFGDHWRHPHSSLAKLVRAYRTPDSRLAVWGWLSSVHVESVVPQAARDTHTETSISFSPRREAYRERYLEDIRQSQPDFFVDAVGPSSHYFLRRAESAHETFPALAEYVSANYREVAELGYARLFVSNRLLALHGDQPPLPEFIDAGANGDLYVPEPESITPDDAQVWRMRDRTVQMLIPPAEAVWPLGPEDRIVILEYGYQPEAYLRGQPDGAELNVELRAPDGTTRPVFHRYLSPVYREEDRGTQTTRIPLPPFSEGTRLVVRTGSGPDGNDMWDWVYLSGIRYVQSPSFQPEQFPTYNRTPESVEAGYSFIVSVADGDDLLMLHAPAAMTFVLDGTETRLRFGFGFNPGAHSGEGQTDGAAFIVEHESPGQAPAVIFRRHLQPLGVEADRGEQSAELALPAIRAGDRLHLRIDPGPNENAAWDWTYVNRFTLE